MNDNNHVNDIPEDGDDTVERARVALNLDFELKLLQIKSIKTIISNISTGRPVAIILPTGFGKTLICCISGRICFARMNKVFVFISPTKALTRNLIESVRNIGVKCCNIYEYGSDVHSDVEIIVGTPESFEKKVDAILKGGGISGIIFDEAHLVLEWGYEFRKAYISCLDILVTKKELSKLLIVYVSASLTQKSINETSYLCGRDRADACAIVSLITWRTNVFLNVVIGGNDENLITMLTNGGGGKQLVICSSVEIANATFDVLKCIKDGNSTWLIDHSCLSPEHSLHVSKEFISDINTSLITTCRWLQGINCTTLTNVLYYGFPI